LAAGNVKGQRAWVIQEHTHTHTQAQGRQYPLAPQCFADERDNQEQPWCLEEIALQVVKRFRRRGDFHFNTRLVDGYHVGARDKAGVRVLWGNDKSLEIPVDQVLFHEDRSRPQRWESSHAGAGSEAL
jgi:hypothetical protein